MRKVLAALVLIYVLFASALVRADVYIAPVRLYYAQTAATSNVVSTLSGFALTVGGVLCGTNGMRVLLTAQTDTTKNGIWIVRSGAWERAVPSATGNAMVYVLQGLNKGACYSANWDGAGASAWACN